MQMRCIVYLSMKLNIPVILGTATPSVDSAYNVLQGKYKHVGLEEKFQQVEPPEITIVDLKKDTVKGESRLFAIFLFKTRDRNLFRE